ncbi:hypothetical protein QJS10_CPB17g01699 [Acorus calamus]|uniref:Uncharacterized protein n=1 Tax=Acorus calamus TaxID=4465 RepID=A0AAV9CYR2_ACOCL|nr:hypothetical protein QJS10_CPB17g01699 [Acorus calamus]
MEPPSPNPSRPLAVDGLCNLRLTYTCEFLKKLKSRLPPNYSTFSALLGHVWVKLTESRGLSPDEPTKIYVSVNGRPRLKLPDELFGNIVLNVLPCATAQELLKGGAAEAATRVPDSLEVIIAPKKIKNAVEGEPCESETEQEKEKRRALQTYGTTESS